MNDNSNSRWRKIQDPEEMLQQIRDGYTYAEIAQLHEAKYNIPLTRAAVEYFARANGLRRRRPAENYAAIPWVIASRHSGTATARRLVTWSKMRAGEQVPALQVQDFHDWNAARIAAGSVVHYDPRIEGGFVFVKARPGRDKSLFRDIDLPHADQPHAE